MGLPKKGEAIYMRRSIAQDWAREAAKKQAHLIKKDYPRGIQKACQSVL